MFDHLSLGVSNLQHSIAFYDVVLAPLGIKRLFNLPDVAAYGALERPMFWIGNQAETSHIKPSQGFHLAFMQGLLLILMAIGLKLFNSKYPYRKFLLNAEGERRITRSRAI